MACFHLIGKTKIGDYVKKVLKGIYLVIAGLVAAILIYPFTHELGHLTAAWIAGAEIYEFNLLPIPNVLCKFDSVNLKSVILVGFGGLLFPVIFVGVKPPKVFFLWYLWLAVKCICVLSFCVSFWALIFYQTELGIPSDDMTLVMQFAPQYRPLYLGVIIGFLAITLMQLKYSKLFDRCTKYFDVQ